MGHLFEKKIINIQPITSWDLEKAQQKSTEYYTEALRLADDTIQWYHSSANAKSWCARAIRLTSVVILIISTLIPYFAKMAEKCFPNFLYLGYILAGMGGGLLLMDKFIGYSNSWIRFVTTALELQKIRNDFSEKWQLVLVEQLPFTPATFAALINTILAFQDSFYTSVKTETQKWATEFQQNSELLGSMLKAQADQLKNQYETEKNNQPKSVQSEKTNVAAVTPQILQEAIKTQYAKWESQYGGPFESISVALKRKDNFKQDQFCILFGVNEKRPDEQLGQSKIPAFIPYESNGITYQLPTDVLAVGTTTRNSYLPVGRANYDTGIGVTPKQPGMGCGRDNNNATGTIGMLVKKVDDTNSVYLLSCYHVLCSSELANSIYSITNDGTSRTIICPGLDDKQDDQAVFPIANVTEGILKQGSATDSTIDAAIALVTPNSLAVSSTIHKYNFSPKNTVYINPAHAQQHYPVRMAGRTSGAQEGTVESDYASTNVWYPTSANPNNRINMPGVIMVSKISEEGDSGAVVFDSQNNVLGIIFASNTLFSFIIPIDSIFSQFKITYA